MKVCILQADLVWQNSQANFESLGKKLESVDDRPDLIILPEMFPTGFTMAPERYAEPTEGPCFQWMKTMAARTGSVICGSIAVREKNHYYNRLYWMRPDGSSAHYDKRHLFRMGQEHDHYTAGDKRLIVDQNGWKICPMVCYDLRFPVWSRCKTYPRDGNSCDYEYDILIYVANWPAVRSYAWKQLLIARAIENQCYVIGVNRCGADGNGVAHGGESLIIGPLGEIMLSCDASEQTRCATLDKQKLEEFRKRFPAGLDAEAFEIRT